MTAQWGGTLRLPPDPLDVELYSGLLHKSRCAKVCDTFRGQRKSRWFQLKPKRLLYYERQGDSHPKGEISLEAAIIERAAPTVTHKPHSLRIASAGQSFVYLYCNSADDEQHWLIALRRASGYADSRLVSPTGSRGHSAKDPSFESLNLSLQAWRSRQLGVFECTLNNDGCCSIVDAKQQPPQQGQGQQHAPQFKPQLCTLLRRNVQFSTVSCGENFTCAISTSGTLYVCGANESTQLALGDATPRAVLTENAALLRSNLHCKSVSCGSKHTIIVATLKQEANAEATGQADAATASASNPIALTCGAEVMFGSCEPQPLPIHVASLVAPIASVAANATHSLVLSDAEQFFTFGRNSHGELGNGEAGVEALVRVRFAQNLKCQSAVAGSGFTLTLLRGAPPPLLMHPRRANKAAAQATSPRAAAVGSTNAMPLPLADVPRSDDSLGPMGAFDVAAKSASGQFSLADAEGPIAALLQLEMTMKSNSLKAAVDKQLTSHTNTAQQPQ